MAASRSKASRPSTSSATRRMWNWWRGSGDERVAYVATKHLPPPAVLPDLLADHAIDARLSAGGRHDRALRRAARDLEQQLGADRLLELVALLDRHHEGAGTADDTVFVIEIEVVDIHGGIRRLLHHDRQAVDDDALFQRGIAGDDDRGAVVVRTIAGNIDHAPYAPMRVLVEQLHGEIDRARDRG